MYATGAVGRVASGALSNLAFTNAYNLLANGQPAGPLQDIFSAGLGAATGYASPYVGEALQRTYAAVTGKPTLTMVPLLDYENNLNNPDWLATHPNAPSAEADVNALKSTLSRFGGDPGKAYVITDSNGDVATTANGAPRFFYNDVHIGYASAHDIQDYLNELAEKGTNVNLASTTQAKLPNDVEVKSQHPEYNTEQPGYDAKGNPLRGVRKYAYGPNEGMYFDVPTANGGVIQLNYNPNIGLETGAESSTTPAKVSLNPFGARGTFLTTETTPQDIFLASKAEFQADTGIDPDTPYGKTMFSKWLGEQAAAQGKSFLYPYQNYYPGTNEAQVMAGTGTNINAMDAETVLLKTQGGRAILLKLADAAGAGETPEEAAASLTPEEQQEVAKAYKEAASSSGQNARYVTPYGSILSGVASAQPSVLNALSSTTGSRASVHSISPSVAENVSPSESPSPSPSVSEITSPSISESSSPSVSESISPSVSYSSSPSASESSSPSVSPSSSPSVSTSASPSASPSPSESTSYGQKFKAVEPIPEIAQPMFTSEYTLPTKGPAYTSVYNPSLYTVLFPNSNAEAIANYNPLFPALSQRPLQNPVTMNKPIATTSSTTTTSATAPETSTTTTSTPEATTTTPQYAPTSAYDYISPQALMNVGNALPSHGTPQEQQVINNINTALQSDQLKQGISNYFNARYPQMGFVYPTSLTQPTVEQYLNNNPTYAHTFLKNALPSLNTKYPSQSTFSTSGNVLYNNAQNPYTPANAFSMLYGNAGLNQPISDYMQQLGAQNVMAALQNANRGYSTAEINGLLGNPNYFGSLMGNPAFANMYAPGLSNGYFGNPNLNPQGNLQEMASQLYNNGYIMTPQNTPAWYAEELAQIGAITPEEANYLLSGTEGEPIPTYIGPVQLSEPEAEIKKKNAIGLKT